jgi:hypothetical protein
MSKTTYAVYWTLKGVHPQLLKHTELRLALDFAEELRKKPPEDEISFVTMVCENENQVGRPGVDTVKDGKTPDGVEYSWVKRRPATVWPIKKDE